MNLIVNIDYRVPEKIITDEKRFKQILFNLLGNAIKFTYVGSIKIKINHDSEQLYTEVEDTGIGIKREEQDKLFQYFGRISHQDKNMNQNGLGFGLTICNLIVQQLKGTISF